MRKIYMCIDLKSFYASVECRERNLDPLNTNLVVADESRTEKTICLAVSPSLKAYGLSGRCRLYEAIEKVKEVNAERRKKNHYRKFSGKSYLDSELKENPSLELDFIRAIPRMRLYMKYSSQIYNIYLKYISSSDILVYSIDEVFCDITSYLKTYKLTPKELVTKMIMDVYNTTGITATAGIGTNMYLAKIAMDITAKHMKPNEYGVRIASLDEKTYRKTLWNHQPLTDFWRVGAGISKRLNDNKIYTMGDIARLSIDDEDKLYEMFGVNAELLIDHAWGYEPCTIKDAKSYVPQSSSISSGQVLHTPYDAKSAKIIVEEMTDSLVLDLVKKHLVTDKIVLDIGYDIENIKNKKIMDLYKGDITKDRYGRMVPKPAHGTINIDHATSSTKLITDSIIKLYARIINPFLLIRRINVTFCDLIQEDKVVPKINKKVQLNLFTNYNEIDNKKIKEAEQERNEKEVQRAIIKIQEKYGKNAILKGMNLDSKATMRERNMEVGGHRG